jgi:hypothetical protein
MVPCERCYDTHYYEYQKTNWRFTIPCPSCRDGLSASAIQRVKQKYGACGYGVADHADRSINVKLDPSGKSAVVTVDLKYTNTDKYEPETATWSVDKDGDWTVQEPRQGWPNPYAPPRRHVPPPPPVTGQPGQPGPR